MKANLFDVRRLEAFSDGVMSIVITIMVIGFTPPNSGSFAGLLQVAPLASVYALSFAFVALYWNNHHHLLKAAEGLTASIMWSNMVFLFCLTFIPFVTGWLSKFPGDSAPASLYGLVLISCALSYTLLQTSIIKSLPIGSHFKKSIGRNIKGLLSLFMYLIAIVISLWKPIIAEILYVSVAFLWIIPDKRVERALSEPID